MMFNSGGFAQTLPVDARCILSDRPFRTAGDTEHIGQIVRSNHL